MDWLWLLIGVVVGGLGAWILGRRQTAAALSSLRENIETSHQNSLSMIQNQLEKKDTEILELRRLYDTEHVAHERMKAQLEETQRGLTAQQEFLKESQQKLSDAFKALSKEALSSNTDEFLKLADTRQKAIDDLLKPLNDALKRYSEQTEQLEVRRQKAYGSLEEQLRTVAKTTELLERETANLGQALRKPQVRGRWGELTLRRVAELAGMANRCDFTEQQSVDSEEGKLRPDMIVHLPGQRTIVVDAKVPLVAFLDAVNASNDEERAHHLKRHTNHVRDHMKKLSAKAYWSQFEQTPDYVVMFIPGESFFSAAVDVDRDLIEEGMRSNVILASPTTFIALLRAVAMGWRQEKLADNANQISKLGAEIHDRIYKFVEHFSRVGRSLDQATAAYNQSVGTLQSRVLSTARQFKELGATTQPDIPEIAPIERAVRPVQVDMLTTDD